MKALSLGVTALVLLASAPLPPASAKETTDSLLPTKTYNGIPYISGGFGVEERAAIEKLAKGDNLELSFALLNKDYLGGANVVIKNSKGDDVLKAASDGPLFFTKLPEGKYTVEATARGKTMTQVAQVTDKGQDRLYFAWARGEKGASQTLAKK
ncbi:MAG: hypothetical protein ACM3SP_26690 [Chloroflexota bacterium]